METEFLVYDDYLGKELFGRFTVEGGFVTVHSAYGTKQAPIRNSSAKALARDLLCQLARKEAKDLR